MTINFSVRPYRKILPNFDDSVYIDPQSAVIGDVTLGKDTSIWPGSFLRGDVNYISIGNRSNVQDGSVVHVSRKSESNPAGYPTVVGDDVTIGHKVMLHGCTIGNRVLVGMGVIVLDNVIVGDDVIIGAGSLVPPGKTLDSGFLYLGSPAKQIRPLSDKDKASLTANSQHYVKLKNEYLEEQG
jgi:carbonic anhydrase/acetyltransferase-like protein (isoleucine patch superfamily)